MLIMNIANSSFSFIGIYLLAENSFQLVKNECEDASLVPDPSPNLVLSHYNQCLYKQKCSHYNQDCVYNFVSYT